MKRKVLSILLTLVLVLGFSLVTAVPVAAQSSYYVATTGSDTHGDGTETWVDKDASTNWNAGDTGPWQTIQHAIDSVTAGDTISVAAGVYSTANNGEVFPIVIDKPLTLEGAQFGVDPTEEGARTEESEESVIDSNDNEGNAIEIGANGVVVDGFTVKNVHDEPTDADPTAKYAIKMLSQSEDHSVYSSGITIQYNILTENSRGIYILDNENSLVRKNLIEKCASSTTGTYGWYHGGSGLVISYVTPTTVVTENLLTKNVAKTSYYGPILVSAASGAFVPGGETTQPTITENRIVGNYTEGLSYGILLLGTGAIVRGNIITGNEGGGIWAFDFYALPPENPILIEGNTIAENGLQGIYICHELVVGITENIITNNVGTGVDISGQPADVTLYRNSIAGNGFGVSSGVPIDATNNWWGDASGPAHVSNPLGTGDEVSNNVDYKPWLLSEGGDPFDTSYAEYKHLPDDWSIISPDRAWSNWEALGANLVYAYDAGFSTPEQGSLLSPVNALYVKTNGGGFMGIDYPENDLGMYATNLEAGWNLIGIPETGAGTGAILSPLRYGENDETALATLASQGQYNLSGKNFYKSAFDWTNNITVLTLDPFDGYWAYMNVAKEFGVVVVE